MKQFYTLDRIKKYDADFNLIFGKKGNGKSTACMEECLEHYIDTGEQFVWMRRWQDDFTGNRAKSFFSDIVSRGKVSEWTNGKFDNVVYYQRAWWLAKTDIKTGKSIKDRQECGFAYALTGYEHNNGSQYPGATILVFDEFLTEDELADEFVTFMKCYSNVRRSKPNFKCYMLGNTVSYFSTYWSAMGIDNIHNMKPGDIDSYENSWKGIKVKVACEYCGADDIDESEAAIKVFENKNSKLAMITNGAWEMDEYTQPPEDAHHPWNVKYRCFLSFFEYFFAIDLIKDKNKNLYLFVHPHTTEIPQKSIIYDLDANVDRFHKHSILICDNDLEKLMKDLIIRKKVFYANNETGNVFNAYLNRL